MTIIAPACSIVYVVLDKVYIVYASTADEAIELLDVLASSIVSSAHVYDADCGWICGFTS